MYQTAPVSVTSTVTIANPSDGSQNPAAVAVQIQNNSQYQLTNNLTADITQPNYALTINIPIGFTPLILTAVNFTNSAGSVSTEWLEFNESPSRPDGGLQPSQALPLPWKFEGLFNPVSGTTLLIPISPACTGVLISSSIQILDAFLANYPAGSPVLEAVVILINSSPTPTYLYWIGPLPNTLPTSTGPAQLAVLIEFVSSGAVAYSFEANQPIDFATLGTIIGNVALNVNSVPQPNVSLNLSNPAAGSDWSHTITTAGRLVGFFANFNTSAAAASRYPLFFILFPSSSGDNSVTPLVSGAFPPSIVAGFINASLDAAYFAQPSVPGGYLFANAPLPNIFLPVGAVIGTTTINMQAGDQWAEITLTLSPN